MGTPSNIKGLRESNEGYLHEHPRGLCSLWSRPRSAWPLTIFQAKISVDAEAVKLSQTDARIAEEKVRVNGDHVTSQKRSWLGPEFEVEQSTAHLVMDPTRVPLFNVVQHGSTAELTLLILDHVTICDSKITPLNLVANSELPGELYFTLDARSECTVKWGPQFTSAQGAQVMLGHVAGIPATVDSPSMGSQWTLWEPHVVYRAMAG